MAENGERFGRLEVRMERVEEGVANFKSFQTDMRKFVTRFETNEENRQKTDSRRARIHYALLTLLIGIVIAMFTFILTKLPYIHIGFGPSVVQSSQKQPPQDAGVPMNP